MWVSSAEGHVQPLRWYMSGLGLDSSVEDSAGLSASKIRFGVFHYSACISSHTADGKFAVLGQKFVR